MTIEKKLTFFIGITLLMLISLSSFSYGLSATIPVIQLEELGDTFEPTTYLENNDYYIVEPGTELTLPVQYRGENTDIDYTDATSTAFNIDNYGVEDETYYEQPTDDFLSGDSRSYTQPFLEGIEELPRLARIEEIANGSFDMNYLMPISLHMDYSFTFYADPAEIYYGMIETENAFFFDVFIHDCDAEADVVFLSAMPGGMVTFEEKATTLPVFPYNGTIQNFYFTVDNPTLITLTPHKLKLSTDKLDLGEAVSEQIIQGSLDVEDKDFDLVTNKTNIFSIYTYELEVEENEYYEIYFNLIDYMNIEECDPDISVLFAANLDDYTTISGNFDEDGYRFKAEKTTKLLLVIYTMGIVDLQYTVYFKDYEYISNMITTDLQLNTNITLDLNTYYEFNLLQPALMAINSTSAGSFNVEFYRGDGNGTWTYLTGDGFFNIETGSLIGDNDNDIGTGASWRYIPAGNYAIRSYADTAEEEIQFNVVTVGAATSNADFTLNQDNYAAFELDLTTNRYNFVNISTATHKNESVTLEYIIINKYNDGISWNVHDFDIGNLKTETGWVGLPINETDIAQFVPRRTHDVPILIIRAYDCVLNSSFPLDTFSIALTLTTNVISDYYPYIDLTGIGDGDFLPYNSITTSTSYAVSDYRSDSQHQIYGIPIEVNPNSLYNITIRLIGNYTNSANLNITFDDIYLTSGNLRSAFIFNTIDTNINGLLERNRTSLVLTTTDILYLYVDIIRASSGGYLNGTLRVQFTEIPVNKLSFDVNIESHEWIEDRLDGEEKNSDLLIEWINKKKSAPGFELIALISSMAVLSVLYSKKRK